MARERESDKKAEWVEGRVPENEVPAWFRHAAADAREAEIQRQRLKNRQPSEARPTPREQGPRDVGLNPSLFD